MIIYGRNTLIGFGVMFSGAALGVYGKQKKFSFFAGLGGAALLSLALSQTRFRLLPDTSIGRMIKIGIIQGVVGGVLDFTLRRKYPVFSAIGVGGALATYAPQWGLLGFGVYGAYLGMKAPLRNKI